VLLQALKELEMLQNSHLITPSHPIHSPVHSKNPKKKSPYFTVQIEGLSLIHMLCNVPAFKLIVLLTVRSAEVEEKKPGKKIKQN
jgi:hypothetical protein